MKVTTRICEECENELEIPKVIVEVCFTSLFWGLKQHIKNTEFLFDETEVHPDDKIQSYNLPNIGKIAPKEPDINRYRVDNGYNPITIIVPGTVAGSVRKKIRDFSTYAPRKKPPRGSKGTYTKEVAAYQKARRDAKNGITDTSNEVGDPDLDVHPLLRGINKK